MAVSATERLLVASATDTSESPSPLIVTIWKKSTTKRSRSSSKLIATAGRQATRTQC